MHLMIHHAICETLLGKIAMFFVVLLMGHWSCCCHNPIGPFVNAPYNQMLQELLMCLKKRLCFVCVVFSMEELAMDKFYESKLGYKLQEVRERWSK